MGDNCERLKKEEHKTVKGFTEWRIKGLALGMGVVNGWGNNSVEYLCLRQNPLTP